MLRPPSIRARSRALTAAVVRAPSPITPHPEPQAERPNTATNTNMRELQPTCASFTTSRTCRRTALRLYESKHVCWNITMAANLGDLETESMSSCGTRCEGVVDSCTCWCRTPAASCPSLPSAHWKCLRCLFLALRSGWTTQLVQHRPAHRILAKGSDLLEQCSAMAASCAYSFRLPISPLSGDIHRRKE